MPLLNKPLVSSANFQRTEQEIASLQKEVAANAATATSSSNVPAPSVPLPCTSGTFEGSHGFVIAATQDKKGEFDTFCTMVPAGCTRVGFLIGKTSDQAVRDNTLFHWVPVPDDIAATGGHFETQFPLNLKYDTTYGLIQLIAVVEDPVTGLIGRRTNPAKPWDKVNLKYNYLDTWTTGHALNAPGTPICVVDPTGVTGDIIENTIYVDHDGGHARLTLRAYFAADRTSTAGQMEATKIGVRLRPVAGGSLISASAVANSDSDKFEDITISDLPEGAQFLWQDVWTKHGTGRAFSAIANCAITAGNVAIDLPGFMNMVNGATITFAVVDAKHSLATVTYTQPATPYAIKKIQILRSDTGINGTYNIEIPADRPIAEGVTSQGVKTATYLVKTKVASGSFWRVRILARPGLDWTSSVAFTNTGVADPTGDSGPPGVVQNLRVRWDATHVTYKWAAPATNANSIQFYNVWVTDPLGTSFMQVLGDGTTAAGQLAPTQSKQGSQFQSTARHITVKLKTKNLAGPFSSSFIVNVSAVNLVNGVQTEGPPAVATVAVGVDYLNGTDAVNVIDVSTTLWSPGQILFNGDFLYNNGVASQLASWSFNGSPLDTNAGNGAFWDQANHAAVIQNNAGSIIENLKRKLIPGDFYALSFLAKSNSTPTVTVTIALQDVVTSAQDIVQIPSILVAATGTYVPYGCVFQYNPFANAANNHNFVFGWSSGQLFGGPQLIIDRIMVCRGKQPSAYTPRVSSYEVDGITGNENPNFAASAAAAGGFDISNPTGSNPAQGRWFGPGFGGLLSTQ